MTRIRKTKEKAASILLVQGDEGQTKAEKVGREKDHICTSSSPSALPKSNTFYSSVKSQCLSTTPGSLP